MTVQPAFDFDEFRLLPLQRSLLRAGQTVKLGSRAFDLLLVLVQQRERTVLKSELLDMVWPGAVVEESNLAVQVMALRKVLGPHAIATLPGRGYRFTLPVVVVQSVTAGAAPEPAGAGPPSPAPRHNLPLRADPLLGRGSEVGALVALLQAHAQVTLVGTGGVGKTRLAQCVAEALLPQHPDGVWWVELATLADPALVAPTVARVLRTAASAERDSATAVADTLRGAQTLLVLDNAEHVLSGVAPLLALVARLAPQARVLVTSQELLRTPGEHAMRLQPLALPQGDGLQAVQDSSAVALFSARARAADAGFSLTADNASVVADICRQLDGIPLAIELAVARLSLLGLHGLQQKLDERLHVLTTHQHASLPRHQTLRAALEWSHGLLSPVEQRVLRRLAVFAGGFTLEAAQAVAQDDDTGPWAVLDALGALVDKSLVLNDGQPLPRLRLLESTRLYALERLSAAREQASVQERHGRALHTLLTVVREDARRWRTPPAEPAALVAELDNARAALAWATGCDDDALAVSLAAGCSHVFLAASLNAEYLERVLPLRPRVHPGIRAADAGLFWSRIALASSRNAHPAGLDAALQAAAVYRSLGNAERLYDALTWSIAIGARHGQAQSVQALVDEARALEDPAWPPAARSSFQWACHRWLLLQGRTEEALQCAWAQAELLALDGSWLQHVAWGANVADCELTLGRVAPAQQRARTALQALDAMGIDENLVGHVMDVLMIACTLQGQHDQVLSLGRRARRLLDREGDDLRLLDTLALNAAGAGRWSQAAQVAGHADMALAKGGHTRWPGADARRVQLRQCLQAALSPDRLDRDLAAGAQLSRDAAFALGFDERSAG